MSLSSVMSVALSGLTVTSRAADIVSSNISNAMTDGYGVRQVSVTGQNLGNGGSGARVLGVLRIEDAALIGHRRRAEAEFAFGTTQGQHLNRLEGAIGIPDTPASLAARSAAFEAALTAAAASPHNQVRLAGAVDAAVALAGTINGISDGIQAQRLAADGAIARGIERFNGALGELATLNTRIRRDGGARRMCRGCLMRRPGWSTISRRLSRWKAAATPAGPCSSTVPMARRCSTGGRRCWGFPRLR